MARVRTEGWGWTQAATDLAWIGLAAAALAAPLAASADDRAQLAERAKAIFGPLGEVADNPANPVTDAKVELGRMLYYDPRFSKNHDISCNTCHLLDRFGVDGEATSPGHKGQRGDRNSPTVFNAAPQIAQFWDGRAADVEEQAKGPVLNPVEMALPGAEAIDAMLRSIPGYAPAFAAAFPDEEHAIDFDHFALAVGAFERTLLTPGRFDAFMQGELERLDREERAGLALFMDVGCITCHNGPTVGGLMFQKLGAIHPYETEDLGRMEVTGNESDRHVFKVPTLRNIAETGPWFHDGSIVSLDEAVRLMAHHQLGRELEDAQVASIVAFLGALTGEIDAEKTAKPELPPSGPDTPAPDPS